MCRVRERERRESWLTFVLEELATVLAGQLGNIVLSELGEGLVEDRTDRRHVSGGHSSIASDPPVGTGRKKQEGAARAPPPGPTYCGGKEEEGEDG